VSNEIRMTFSCKQCGSNALTVANKCDDTSLVTCNSCGAVAGTWGELKAAAADKAKEAVKKELKDGLLKSPERSKNFRME
jgi:uncharacterized Zn finger protein